jgi:hypothetical protein
VRVVFDGRGILDRQNWEASEIVLMVIGQG